ncbi:hypothetical protein A2856_01935 [Candidatus Uhrbacteria bacterium RIFCSPHIGHO2_01_FULL_63_20]|uniref:Uncharacterized protein n=1 Tax=Candidatus Uhrbacteria bacterium RIFCSPHIGHO2_01_FULL_63_20 TaxID=1802385 RepID=A0A1F7TKE0_9BACT|nr:MAG: hypothetical protein A2856_01935 [Candidatus Uhrbacteria bacterium RIFCSPHIGHO2_01_FULL_63_20]
MSLDEKRTLEALLTRIGSEPAPLDAAHFYRLRRALLSSDYFEQHRTAEAVAEWMLSASTALATGAVAVAVVVSVRVSVLRPTAIAAAPTTRPVQAASERLLPDGITLADMGEAWHSVIKLTSAR